jgi:hypothetical protein
VFASAQRGAGNATVDHFPAMNAMGDGAVALSVTCTAPLGAGGSNVTVQAGVDGTAFPLGTTPVACIARTTSRDTSPAVTFSVVVGCDSGYVARGLNPRR